MGVELNPHQIKAWKDLKNACILRGGVGAGKSRIAIAYFWTDVCGGGLKVNGRGTDAPAETPVPLYVITTAKKRESLEWQSELARFAIGTDDSGGWLGRPVVIDSWNNIAKYAKVEGAFFIFDEQRLVGSGSWVKAFYRIARKNRWIILTATPGDTWLDYVPIFVASGFYSSKAEFLRRHAVYNAYANYPKIDRYVGESELLGYLGRVLIEVDYAPHTKRHLLTVPCEYDRDLMDLIWKKRWNPWENQPVKDAGELFRLMRRVANSDDSRTSALRALHASNPRLIVFYSFDYELERLRALCTSMNVPYAEWNGHRHMEIPSGDTWLYLVQYTAGSEGWNCITTDTVVFFSLTYSHKAFEQAQGRIDRMNTPFGDLYYHVFRSNSMIDKSIWSALVRKRNFNERALLKKHGVAWESEALVDPLRKEYHD